MPADDPPDLDGLVEHPATAAATLADRAAAAVPWAPPRPLDAPPPPPPFPVEALPVWLRAMVCALADACQTPVDLAAALALPLVGGALAHRVVADAARWCEPPNLYTVIVADSGEGKSSVFGPMLRPVYDAQRDARERGADDRRRALTARKILTARVDSLTTRVAKGDAAPAELDALTEELDALHVPAEPLYVVGGDATPEALALTLAEHGERLAIADPEGGAFSTLTGVRYAKNGGANLDLLLKAVKGESVDVRRVGAPPVSLRSPLLSLALCVQPRVWHEAVSNPDLGARGFLPRMLVVWPESRVGQRSHDRRSWPAGVEEDYAARMGALWREAVARNENGAPTPAVYAFADGADALWRAWCDAVEARLRPGRDLHAPDDLRAAAGKMKGWAVRLACILHAADRVDHDGLDLRDRVIAEETVSRAIRIAEYHLDHAARAYGRVAATTATDADARHLLARWGRTPPKDGTVSVRDATEALRATADRAADALETLVDHGYLRPLPPPPPRQGGGRPPSPRYSLHPSLRPAPPAPKGGFVGIAANRCEPSQRMRVTLTPRVSP